MQAGFPIDGVLVDSGFTMLQYAASSLKANAVQALLNMGADVNARDMLGRTALHAACKAGNLETFVLLTELDATELNA